MTEPMPEPSSAPSNPLISDADRQSALAQAVARSVATGARVESHAPFQAIMVRGHKPNHTLHLILTLVTCGLWGLVWLVLAFATGEKRTVLSVDPYGNILSQ